MERDEEIRQASHEYINSDIVKAGGEHFAFGDFINGAKWADKHPRKGLVDIEKVIEYLDKKYVIIGRNWAEFRKTMEG